MTRIFTGGCLCGEVRFRIEGETDWPHYCSCSMCQRWSGAPLVAWVDMPLAGLTWVAGYPKLVRTSAKTQRGFCGTCGSSLFALDDGSDKICMTITSIDQANDLVPEAHSFADKAPAWLHVTVPGSVTI